MFGGLDQATIQAFVRQVGTGELGAHPLHRRRTGLDDSLNLGPTHRVVAKQSGTFVARRDEQQATKCTPLCTAQLYVALTLAAQRSRLVWNRKRQPD